MKKTIIAPALLALVSLAACGSDASGDANAATTELTLTEAMEQAPDVSGLLAAIRTAGLTDVFSAPGGYTVIAPPNAAFAELTGEGEDAVPPPVLAAMLREQMLPGQLDLDSIRQAIADNGGKISVATMGTGMIEFAIEGEDVVATHSDSGLKAKLTGSSVQASNGALLLADSVLVAPPQESQ